MLFKGPKINDIWIAPVFFVIAVIASLIIKFVKPLNWGQFCGFLANLEGTVMVATSISFNIPPHGRGLWNNLKWVFTEFHNYGSPPSFNFIRFYLGLILIFLGMIVTALFF